PKRRRTTTPRTKKEVVVKDAAVRDAVAAMAMTTRMTKTIRTTRTMKAAVAALSDSRLQGAGLGLRRPLMSALLETTPDQVSFLEVAPENWMRIGGERARRFRTLAERYPLVAHGLSLSLGGPAPLNEAFLHELK